MSSDNIATKKIISPRFPASPSKVDEQKRSMPRVELARKSMPVDKFSIFDKRKGQTNDEMVKSPNRELKQPRKEDAAAR